MKPRLFAILSLASASLALAGCQTPATAPNTTEAALIASELASIPEADRLNVAGAVATEIGVRFRCPHDANALAVLRFLRLGFDQLLRPRVSVVSAALVDRLRVAADGACGI